jgi:GNAT superfamily N-acetyltransferase
VHFLARYQIPSTKRSEIIESHDQFASLWKVLAGNHTEVDLRDRAGLSVCWADSPFPLWNALFLNERLLNQDILRVRLRASLNYMKSKKHGGLIFVCKDVLGDAAKAMLDEIVASEKLVFSRQLTGMAGDMLPLDASLAHPVLDFARVDNETALQTYADIISDAYGWPIETGRAGLMKSGFWKKVTFAYIGYLNGEAVSTAAAIVNDGALSAALAATRPHAQRKGFGETTARYALNAAYYATGIRRTALHATVAARPVYQRLGFHRTTAFNAYAPA